jgi:hypothetical protein
MYLIYVSKKKPPSERELDRLVGIHQTEQDSVRVVETDDLASGFSIKKIDHENIQKTGSPELKDYLNIKDYKFKTRITAKQNEQNIKDSKQPGSNK